MADDEGMGSGSGFLSKAWKFLAGLLFIGLAALSIYYWWSAFLTLIAGAVGVVLAIIGLVFFMLAFTE
ncbi:hypothetical protein J4417_03240 [Candidatus Woesearchaeota archaeon]|nr:hypothetical protein [Candidatus Woesearchaeota archaeon]